MTELDIRGGMHIESDPDTGAIAASPQTETPDAVNPDKPVQIDPRRAIMEKIYGKRDEILREELGLPNPIEKDSDIQEPEQEDTSNTPITEKRKIIVGDKEIELTQDEIVSLAKEGLKAKEQPKFAPIPTYQPLAPLPQQPVYQQPVDEVAIMKELARKITYGNEDEAAQALLALRGNIPSSDQIAQDATRRALQHLEFNYNLNTVGREFPDIMGNPSRMLVAENYVKQLHAHYSSQGINKPDIELYREAGQRTREDFGIGNPTIQPQEAKTDQPARDLETKTERKRAAPKHVASTNRTLPMEKQKTYLTGSDIVSKMRKDRGQAVY